MQGKDEYNEVATEALVRYILTGHGLRNGQKTLRTVASDSTARHSISSGARILGRVGRCNVAQLENGDHEGRFIDGDSFIRDFVGQVKVLRTRGPGNVRNWITIAHASESQGLTSNSCKIRWGTDDNGRRCYKIESAKLRCKFSTWYIYIYTRSKS